MPLGIDLDVIPSRSEPVIPSVHLYDAAADMIIGQRSEQQDAVRLANVRLAGGRDALLLLVADGMGGHLGGAVASRLAVDSFVERFETDQEIPDAQRLRSSLDSANLAIRDGVDEQPSVKGMGCTLVAALLCGRQIVWISVGDSLLLEASGGLLRRLNQDHSMAAVFDAQAALGEISQEEASNKIQRNMLRSALTGSKIALIDEGSLSLSAGALLVVATDGILTVPKEMLANLAASATKPTDLVVALLAAISIDMEIDQDNTTLAVARVPGSVTRPVSGDRPAPQAQRRFRFGVFGLIMVILIFAASLGLLYL